MSVSFSPESLQWDTHPAEALSLRWAAARTVIGELERRGYQVRLVCHNDHDLTPARQLARKFHLRSPLKATSSDNARTVRAVACVSYLARPWRPRRAFTRSAGPRFCTDSRAELAQELGIPLVDDRIQTESQLLAALDRLLAGPDDGPSPVLLSRMASEEADLRTALGSPIHQGVTEDREPQRWNRVQTTASHKHALLPMSARHCCRGEEGRRQKGSTC